MNIKIMFTILNFTFFKWNPLTLKDIFSFLTLVATVSIAYVVYKYTTDNYRRQLLNSLDEKSGWRKSLFQLAGKSQICICDINTLRATLRYSQKENTREYFDSMSNIMIDYCENVTKNKNEEFTTTVLQIPGNDKRKYELVTKFNAEIIRLFARYLLADHWEKNQLTSSDAKELEKYKNENIIKNISVRFISTNNIDKKMMVSFIIKLAT